MTQIESMNIKELKELRRNLNAKLKKIEEILESKIAQKNKNSIIESIDNAAEIYDWTKIAVHNGNTKKVLSYIQSKQRINIWIKSKTITIRVQPLEMIFKDIEPQFLNAKLQKINALIIKEGK